MAENKTQKTKASVAAFLAGIPDPERRKQAKVVAALMRRATGDKPAMWGDSIVGYGDLPYVGSSGRKVDWFDVGFSPRKNAITVYLMGGLRRHATLLKSLGPHKLGGGCLYLTRFDEVDLGVLEELVARTKASNPPVVIAKRVANTAKKK